MVTFATQSLSSCNMCEQSLFRIGDTLVGDLPEITFLPESCLPQDLEKAPRATVGLVTGVVRTRQDLRKLHLLRRRVDILLAIGTCATAGGIPALCDAPGVDLPAALQQRNCTVPGPPSSAQDSLYELMPRCNPVSDYVTVDLNVPGCPPHPDWLAECVLSLMDARTPRMPSRCVCDTCPARRSGTRSLTEEVVRMLESPDAPHRRQLEEMSCLLEQGFMCMGPVTRAGCGGKGGAPHCIGLQIPCRGCYGSVNDYVQPLADFTSALAATGYDPRTMPDKPGFLSRYVGFRMLDLYRRTPHE